MAHLLSLANEICDGLGDHIEETEKIGKTVEGRYGQVAMKEIAIPALKQGLKETKKKADEMPTEIERAKSEVSAQIAHLKETLWQGFEIRMAEMQNQFTSTQKRLYNTENRLYHTENRLNHSENWLFNTEYRLYHAENRLNNTESDLLKIKADLHAGQTAYDLECYLCKYIYPPETFAFCDQKFTTLMNWLKVNEDTPEGREGNRKWKELKDEYGWTDKTHKPVFLEMIRCRFSHAHPMVDFSLPIPENFNTSEKECVEDIRKMTAALYALVHKCNQ